LWRQSILCSLPGALLCAVSLGGVHVSTPDVSGLLLVNAFTNAADVKGLCMVVLHVTPAYRPRRLDA